MGEPQKTRFVLLGQQRVGSNFLLSMLGRHPDVLAFGEIFSSPKNLQWGSGTDDETRRLLPRPDEALVARRNADPIGFLQTHVFGGIAEPYRAVGFKLFYEHCRDEATRRVWDWLRDSTDIKIIHLKRRNILRTLLSKRLANATAVWYATEKDGYKPTSIALKEKDCREFFERTLMAEREADWLLRRHACLPVYYEDLEEQPAATLCAAQVFLGVRPVPAESPLVKQQTLPLPVAIENFAELEKAFAGSHTRLFFEAGEEKKSSG